MPVDDEPTEAATTEAVTTDAVTTEAASTEDTEDTCRSILCGVDCQGACGWSKKENACIAGAITTRREHALGECGTPQVPDITVPNFHSVGSQGCCVPELDDGASSQPEGTFYNIVDQAQCAMVCNAYNGCAAFSYNQMQSCRLHWSVSDTVDSAAGCVCFHRD